MRLWTLHPRYLDPQGLVALWREGLLARAVLRGETKGYRHHPQLERFQEHVAPTRAIDCYLSSVVDEADARGYRFDRSKIASVRGSIRLRATTGQLAYEWEHLLAKLKARSPALHRRWRGEANPATHPLFHLRAGSIATWERP